MKKKLFIENSLLVHLMGCPNRDDANIIKSVQFGNSKRNRFSSQSQNYAVERYIFEEEIFPPDQKGERTRVVGRLISSHLVDKGRDEKEATLVANVVLEMLIKVYDGKTGYLLSVAPEGVKNIVDICENYWEDLLKLACSLPAFETSENEQEETDDEQEERGKTKNKKIKDQRKKLTDEFMKSEIGKKIKKFEKESDGLFAVGCAANIAMKGRMVADNPIHGVESALQQSHAFTTNAVKRETDFYIAMDSVLKQAGMMDHQSFGSGNYYRYFTIDAGTVLTNVNGDKDLAKKIILVWLEANYKVVPDAKKGSYANNCFPDFVSTTIRTRGLNMSLCNAFVNPVRSEKLMEESTERLSRYWDKLIQGWPDQNAPFLYYTTLEVDVSKSWQRMESVGLILERVSQAIDEFFNSMEE